MLVGPLLKPASAAYCNRCPIANEYYINDYCCYGVATMISYARHNKGLKSAITQKVFRDVMV